VGDTGGVQQTKESVDKQVEQQRGENRALDCSRAQLNGCCVFSTDLHPHGGVLVDVLEQPDIRDPEPLQDRPQALVACRVQGIFEV